MASGLRFERRGEGDYYKVILHVGDMYVPVSDEDVEALRQHGKTGGDGLPAAFLDRVGYSSYLKDRIRDELAKIGGPSEQAAMLLQSIQAL